MNFLWLNFYLHRHTIYSLHIRKYPHTFKPPIVFPTDIPRPCPRLYTSIARLEAGSPSIPRHARPDPHSIPLYPIPGFPCVSLCPAIAWVCVEQGGVVRLTAVEAVEMAEQSAGRQLRTTTVSLRATRQASQKGFGYDPQIYDYFSSVGYSYSGINIS